MASPLVLLQHTGGVLVPPTRYPVRLTLKVSLTPHGGPAVDLSALVDTGAEVNIIRPGLVEDIYFRSPNRVARLVAANQTTLSGGRRELDCVLTMYGVESDTRVHTPIDLPFVCYDADVGVDLLISHEWLASMNLDVYPRRNGLMANLKDRQLWIPGEWDPRYPREVPDQAVGVVKARAKPPHVTFSLEPPTDVDAQAHSSRQVTQELASKDYAVRDIYVQEIQQQLGLKPTIDCFASSTNNRFPRFITKEMNSIATAWGADEVCWMNPPWNLWPEAATKLKNCRNAAIAICPAWSKPWVKDLVGMASKKIYFEKGTRFFEHQGHPVSNTMWGTWALRIDKGPRKEFDPNSPLKGVYFSPAWRPIKSVGQTEGNNQNKN